MQVSQNEEYLKKKIVRLKKENNKLKENCFMLFGGFFVVWGLMFGQLNLGLLVDSLITANVILWGVVALVSASQK